MSKLITITEDPIDMSINFNNEESKKIINTNKKNKYNHDMICNSLANDILKTRKDNKSLQYKINTAKSMGKKSVNIYSAGKYERVVIIPDNKLYMIDKHDIDRGYINYNDQKIEINRFSGESIVPLIRGSKYNKKSLIKILETKIVKSFWVDMERQYRIANNILDDNQTVNKDDLKFFSKNLGKAEPRIFLHYNSRWSNKKNSSYVGTFLIELDWSGDPHHKGMRPDNVQYKKKKNDNKIKDNILLNGKYV